MVNGRLIKETLGYFEFLCLLFCPAKRPNIKLPREGNLDDITPKGCTSGIFWTTPFWTTPFGKNPVEVQKVSWCRPKDSTWCFEVVQTVSSFASQDHRWSSMRQLRSTRTVIRSSPDQTEDGGGACDQLTLKNSRAQNPE